MRWLRSYGVHFSLCEDDDNEEAMAPDLAIIMSSGGAV
jgi:hypothetical protein